MEQLISSVEHLLQVKNNKDVVDQFYTNLGCLKINNDGDTKLFNSHVLPKIYRLYDNQILHKDLLYLTLLASQNHDVLDKVIQYDKVIFNLDIEDPVSLFDYCIYHNDHWLGKLIRDHDKFKKLKAAKNVYKRLMLLKFIEITNRSEIDLCEIQELLTQINTGHLPDEDFWKFYCGQITRFIDIVAFCRDVGRAEDIDGIFKHASNNKLLQTLSVYMDLSEATQWDSVLDKIQQCGEQREAETFACFTIMVMLLKLLTDDCRDIPLNDIVENIRNRTVNLKNAAFQIELLENMFGLLFHRRNKEFMCKEKDIRLLLFIVKAIIDELKMNKAYVKQLEGQLQKRFAVLNSYLNDAMWRLDLVTAVKNTPKVEDQLMNYLLAPPESLVHLCLRRSDYERAYQVVEIFNLQQCDIAYEIGYAEKFLKFKDFLKERARLKTAQKISIQDFAGKFFEGEKHVNLRHEKLIDENKAAKPFVTQYSAKNAKFIDIFDLAITSAKSRQDYKEMLQVAKASLREEHPTSFYYRFYKRICEASKTLDLAPCEILVSPKYNLDMSAHRKLENFYVVLAELFDEFNEQLANNDAGILNRNHATHKTILKINELLSQNFESVQYVKKLFNYLQAFSKVFYIEQNTSDLIAKDKNASYFELLHYNRSELIGILLFEKHLDPTEFEKYFGKLKLDFLYAVVGNCFPTINLHAQENISHDELYHDNLLYKPTKAIIEYIEKHNWLLAFILLEMYKVPNVQINISEVRLKTFFNFLRSPRIQNLKTLFGNNEMVAAIQNCINGQQVKKYFDEKIVEYDLMSIHSGASDEEGGGNNFFETGQEILEDAKTTNWKHLLDIIESIPENQRKRKLELVRSADSVLANLVQDGFEPGHYNYVHAIRNADLRIETILNNFKKWPGASAMDVIRSEVTRFDSVDDDPKIKILKDWLKKIEFSEKLEKVLGFKDWCKSYDYCKSNKDYALKALLQISDVDLLLEFIDIFAPIDEETLSKIELNYVTKIIELNTPPVKVKTLLDKMPFTHSINICNNLLTILRKLEYLQFIADYLNTNVTDDVFLKNVQVSLKMLTPFTVAEQDQLFCLISEPMSIIEVLLMNTKLDNLAAVLDILKVHENLYDENIISTGKIDELLRKYAEKSLDFRVIAKPTPLNIVFSDPKLLESVDSGKVFVMPEKVPTKEEWAKNEDVWECMCCQQVTFSMFNRRHHCRRCGRMVCYSCSTKRMLVQSYGDILVRVCKDCYDQTIGTSCSSDRSDGTSSRSISHEYWLLNDDPVHNQIVREEFSYEHAPSVSLCLSILKYHSKSPEYPKFLLDRCEDMLKLLKPCADENLTITEIDYQLVIKMLKSLVSAAKVLSSEILNSSSSADRILNQVELLNLLSQQGCLNLMPVLNPNSCYLDRTVLRSLRDKLLKREQWHLALEVSTKGGLDNSGVWAAWGKSCLKAGCLATAREKFQRCLDKSGGHETGSLSMSSRFSSNDSLNVPASRTTPPARISTSDNSRAAAIAKNPPLLFEIVNILERKTRKVYTYIDNEPKVRLSGSSSSLSNPAIAVTPSDPAIDVLNRIKNLQMIVNGGSRSCEFMNIERASPGQPGIDVVFYDECVYYLSRYGTPLSLLEFYVRHGSYDAAVEFVLSNHLNAGVFVELYMRCLKDGVVHHLQHAMMKVDTSLEIFREHIKAVCFNLEKRSLLNCLYHLQLFMGDYVRASMTCIRFYEADANNFTDLKANLSHLHKAAQHLKQIKEVEWVDVSTVKSDSESEDKFEEKILTPSSALVMKMESKDLDKHINTIACQIELVNYLSECESSGIKLLDILKELAAANDSKTAKKFKLPTLFSTADDKALLAALVLVCRDSMEDGFKMVVKIVRSFQLRPVRVYGLAGKYLAQTERYDNIMQLVKNIKSLESSNPEISNVLDETLNFAVGVMIKRNVTGTMLVKLSKLIKDRAMKINALIEAKELSQALYLASKYKRINDVRRIQREAELLNSPSIKTACIKILSSAEASTSNQ